MSRDSIWAMNVKVDAANTELALSPAVGGAQVPLLPGNLFRCPQAREVQITAVVHSVGGAPTTAQLELELWDGQRYEHGPMWAWPVFQKYTAKDLTSKVVEGEDFGIVATHTMTGPVMVSRTLKHPGIMPRIRVKPTFTGGTSPYFMLSISAYLKD